MYVFVLFLILILIFFLRLVAIKKRIVYVDYIGSCIRPGILYVLE